MPRLSEFPPLSYLRAATQDRGTHTDVAGAWDWWSFTCPRCHDVVTIGHDLEGQTLTEFEFAVALVYDLPPVCTRCQAAEL